jgi:integrase/recombinase XerD
MKYQFLSLWIKKFLLNYLIDTRNLSRNTQQSYRDTFRLLVPFVIKKTKNAAERLLVTDLSAQMVKNFLSELTTKRNCSKGTANQRLAAIHAFAKFVSLENPEYLEWYRNICSIQFQKNQQSIITYLEKPEMDALLAMPDRKKHQGQRDYAILLFLYNTGARADEVAQLTIFGLNLSASSTKNFSSVLIKGKGNKSRCCPLWQQTVKELELLIRGREEKENIFLNRFNQPMTRFGIYGIVKKYTKKLVVKIPSLAKKRVSPHVIRHYPDTLIMPSPFLTLK